jgi:hypothetical protein
MRAGGTKKKPPLGLDLDMHVHLPSLLQSNVPKRKGPATLLTGQVKLSQADRRRRLKRRVSSRAKPVCSKLHNSEDWGQPLSLLTNNQAKHRDRAGLSALDEGQSNAKPHSVTGGTSACSADAHQQFIDIAKVADAVRESVRLSKDGNHAN